MLLFKQYKTVKHLITKVIPYDISVNKNNGTYAKIDSANDSDLTDSLQVAMKKLPDNTTRISIKYGSQGNSIRSSALVGIIEGNIRYANI